MRVAAIDLGTNTTRLLVADVVDSRLDQVVRRTKITRLGEGSQALRMMWGAYGAGAARTQMETRFVDTRTGEVKLVTADRRTASVGMWGGDSKDHLKESYDDMARDLGRFLGRLSRGETADAKP